MLLCLMGAPCVGKGSVAALLRAGTDVAVYRGKAYRKLTAAPNEAVVAFRVLLQRAAEAEDFHIIYIIEDVADRPLLPPQAFVVLMVADIDILRARSEAKKGQRLTPPALALLEKKANRFNTEPCDLRLCSNRLTPEELADKVRAALAEKGMLISDT